MIEKAIEALEANHPDKAHELVQNMETTEAYWLHGIVHRLEGDLDNARYWYRRAGREFAPDARVEEEVKAIKERLSIK